MIVVGMDRRTLLKLLSAPVISRLPARAAAAKDRVVIAGAGIMGASIGYHLAKRGAQVTILEKRRPGNGATEKSFAWINATFSKQPRAYYDLNFLGIGGWRRLTVELAGDLQVQWGGSVQWFERGSPDADKLPDKVRSHQRWGYPAHLVDESEIRRLLPPIAPGPVGTACFNEIEGTVDPMEALGVLLKHAQQLGAKVEYPCEVTGISMAGDRVRGVETTNGPIAADFLVLASGVDTPRLARMVGVNVPLKESPGLLAHTTQQPRMLDRIALAPGTNIKQNPDGRIVTGTDFEAAATLDTGNEFGVKLLHNAERFLDRLKGVKVETVTLGHRVLPQDGHPVVGFVQRCPNLYITAMHSGITLSPFIGQVAAMEILDGADVDLLKPFRPGRFA
jgi:glycine/D-amino acid oxidase-like deaminating enzyme